MATDRSRSAVSNYQEPHHTEKNVKSTVRYNYRVQSAPPLFIKHFLRASTGVLAGAQKWQSSGKYHAPVFRNYLSPAVYEKPKKVVEPVWKTTGPVRAKPAPTPAFSPEAIVTKPRKEPVWNATSPARPKPVPAFSPEATVQKPPKEPVWNVTGPARPKPTPAFSPSTIVQKRAKEPVWNVTGPARPKPPPSWSPERIIPERVREPVWHAPGQYHSRPPTSLSPERIVSKPVPQPIWNATGPYRSRSVTSLSPEKIIPTRVSEPVWNPAGRTKPKPVPYFDPPALRWSYQELLRSMPELRPKTFQMSTSRSMSALHRTQDDQET